MEEDLQSTCLSRGRVALSVGPRCLLRPDPPPLFRLLNTPPLISNRFWAQRSMRQIDGGGDANDRASHDGPTATADCPPVAGRSSEWRSLGARLRLDRPDGTAAAAASRLRR